MYNLMFGTILSNFISTLLFVTSQHFNSHLNLRCFCLSCTNVSIPSIIILLYMQQLAKLTLPHIQNTIRIYKNVTSYFPPVFFYVVFYCCSCRYMSKKTHGGMIMRVCRKTRRKTWPSAILSTTNPTWNNTGTNSAFCDERSMNNRLSHGTDLLLFW
jgi:hypothetical protein